MLVKEKSFLKKAVFGPLRGQSLNCHAPRFPLHRLGACHCRVPSVSCSPMAL